MIGMSIVPIAGAVIAIDMIGTGIVNIGEKTEITTVLGMIDHVEMMVQSIVKTLKIRGRGSIIEMESHDQEGKITAS